MILNQTLYCSDSSHASSGEFGSRLQTHLMSINEELRSLEMWAVSIDICEKWSLIDGSPSCDVMTFINLTAEG